MQTLGEAFPGFMNLDKLPSLVGEHLSFGPRPCSFICIYVFMKYMLHRVTYVRVCHGAPMRSPGLDNAGRMFRGISIDGVMAEMAM